MSGPLHLVHRHSLAIAVDSVEVGVTLKGVFEMQPRQAERLLSSAISLLQTWQSSYLQVRKPQVRSPPHLTCQLRQP